MENDQETEEITKLVIGYGTFIIKSANGDVRFNKIGVAKIKDFFRLYHPRFQHLFGYWYPFAIEKKHASFKALVYEVTEKDLVSLDEYEGVPGLFQRITCNISLHGEDKEAELYIPSDYTQIRLREDIDEYFSEREKKELYKRDYWLEYLQIHHKYLEDLYPELFI
ncbi:MAG: gamma-glutamylcyclotransferase [Candidatus Lokiarchaeota archaeon]|nr:gamma-glutamylcyclotransferase [Candidatus Lokiarchaeota archaeon]